MKKSLIFLTFIFCVGFVSAQTAKQLLNQIGRAPVKTVKPKGALLSAFFAAQKCNVEDAALGVPRFTERPAAT